MALLLGYTVAIMTAMLTPTYEVDTNTQCGVVAQFSSIHYVHYVVIIKHANYIRFFVNLRRQTRTIILALVIKYFIM